MQTSNSAPGQLAAAIAKAHPRAHPVMISPTRVMDGQLPAEETEKTLAALAGKPDDGTETAARPD